MEQAAYVYSRDGDDLPPPTSRWPWQPTRPVAKPTASLAVPAIPAAAPAVAAVPLLGKSVFTGTILPTVEAPNPRSPICCCAKL